MIKKAKTLRGPNATITWDFQIGDAVNIITDCDEADLNPWIIEDYDIGWFNPVTKHIDRDNGVLMPCYVLEYQDGYPLDVDDIEERTFFQWALELAEMRFK